VRDIIRELPSELGLANQTRNFWNFSARLHPQDRQFIMVFHSLLRKLSHTGETCLMTDPASRRAFVRALAGLSTSALAAGDGSEAYWRMVKAQFPFAPGVIPMNAANLCPSPRIVGDCVAELTRRIDADCSHQNRAGFPRLALEARQKVAAHLGVTPDEIAILRNTSEGNNLIGAGLHLRPGDEILLWDQNHPTNNVAWDVRASRFGYSVKRVSVPGKPESGDQLAAPFLRAFTPKTRILSLTHVSNTSGICLPVKEICAAARERGIYTHVDGAQSWGALHLDLRDLGCDSFAASAHKWPMGPKEAGVLYIRRDRIPGIWPSIVGPGWGNQVQPGVQGAAKFETLGQRDDACLAGLAKAMDFHAMIGPRRIQDRVLQLAAALRDGLRRIRGVEVATPDASGLSAGVLIVPFPADTQRRVYQGLYEKYGVAASPGLRLCTHIYNTLEDVETAVRGVRELLNA
jgi:selenocysteine lyase/cysteine desulfurase